MLLRVEIGRGASYFTGSETLVRYLNVAVLLMKMYVCGYNI